MYVWGVVENVILSHLGRAGPTERVALCPVSEIPETEDRAGALGARECFGHH